MFIFNRFFSKSSGNRCIIVHVHIFKNAGSTIDSILRKNFGRHFIDHREDRAMIEGGVEYLKKIILDNPKLKALSSHHIRFNPKEAEMEGIEILPIYFLRHPIERVLSVYKYEQKQSPSTPGSIQAKKLDLNDYVLWRMQPEVGGTIRNANTRCCSGLVKEKFIVDELSLESAKENLLNSPCVGIVDRFDDSIKLFENPLKERFPSIQLTFSPQNVGQEMGKSLEERLFELKNKLKESTWEILHRENQFDLLLDSFARNLLEARLKSF